MEEKCIIDKLSLYNGKQLLISASMNKNNKLIQFQLDTGCTYTQISLELAKELGLKSHKKIIGKSAIGNGQEKYDYLCETTIKINNIEKIIVVKVSPSQPFLLGLDVMFLFDMHIFIIKQEYSITKDINYQIPPSFHSLNFSSIMKSLKLTNDDLITVTDLPTPEQAYSELLNAGKSNFVFDLGISC